MRWRGWIGLVVLGIVGCATPPPPPETSPTSGPAQVATNDEQVTNDEGASDGPSQPAVPVFAAEEEARLSAIFEDAADRLNRWHVIRTSHLQEAIDELATTSPEVGPWLLRLAMTAPRSDEKGWPWWALLCGTLVRLQGDAARAALEDLAADPDAAAGPRRQARMALDGPMTAP